MNIVYLIGNGFDLNLGLKTSYKDFYEKHYCLEKSPNDNIEKLKKEIKGNIDSWSELEIALGKHTEKINTSIEFEEIRQDIISNLSKYLKGQEELFDFSKANKHELITDICSPFIKLRNGEKEFFKNLLTPIKHELAEIDFISLNYTSTLDKLIEESVEKKMSVNQSINSYSIVKNVKHIHGTLDERMIIGVNDISQVTNSNFINDEDFIESFVKSEYNKSCSHLVDDECIKLVNKAGIICVFGSSLGETDKFWWELIAKKILENNSQMIIYHYNPNIHSENKLFENSVTKEIKKIKNKFISLLSSPSDEEKEKIKNNIYVGVNTGFFNINK